MGPNYKCKPCLQHQVHMVMRMTTPWLNSSQELSNRQIQEQLPKYQREQKALTLKNSQCLLVKQRMDSTSTLLDLTKINSIHTCGIGNALGPNGHHPTSTCMSMALKKSKSNSQL